MLIRLAEEDDAEQLAQAEYDTAASQEGLLAAKPHEIPSSAFRSKIKQLRVHGLYVVMESQGQLVGHLILEPLAQSAKVFDWPQWQGPNRNAISMQNGLLTEWPKDGPPLAWKTENIGGGYSAPSIAAGRVYGMSNRRNDEVVWALSEDDGKEIWAKRIGPAVKQGGRQGMEGPGSTPTVDGEHLFLTHSWGT